MKRSLGSKKCYDKEEDSIDINEKKGRELKKNIMINDISIKEFEKRLKIDIENKRVDNDTIIIWSCECKDYEYLIKNQAEVKMRYLDEFKSDVVSIEQEGDKLILKSDKIIKEPVLGQMVFMNEEKKHNIYHIMNVKYVLANIERSYKYELDLENIQSGLSSTVYPVKKEGKEYIIKTPRVHNNIDMIDEILNEMKIMFELKNEHIIELSDGFYNFNEKIGSLSFAMITPKGDPLDFLIKSMIKIKNKHGITEEQYEAWCIKQLEQIIKGLKFMHEKGYMHEDIKPYNMVMINDVVKLIDFGSSHKKDLNIIGGTIGYLSPEKFRNIVTEKSDIWAVGVIAKMMLEENLILNGEVDHKQIEELKKISKYPYLKRITEKMLTEDYNYRPDASEMLEEINNVQNLMKTEIENK